MNVESRMQQEKCAYESIAFNSNNWNCKTEDFTPSHGLARTTSWNSGDESFGSSWCRRFEGQDFHQQTRSDHL